MCLSDEGLLLTWGSNTCGQLGTGNKTNSSTPTHTAGDIDRLVEIAAVHNSNISAASVVSGKVYMWGVCRGQNVLSPMETNFSSLDEVFACFASPPCTWKPLSLGTVTKYLLQQKKLSQKLFALIHRGLRKSFSVS
ncbi:RCC1 and BTB domain-containing protein 1 [Geodia barretti]|nr:RCC1 and BTB domain-containing protein 1 [Geodia barretti]